jgi:hypothetical protein
VATLETGKSFWGEEATPEELEAAKITLAANVAAPAAMAGAAKILGKAWGWTKRVGGRVVEWVAESRPVRWLAGSADDVARVSPLESGAARTLAAEERAAIAQGKRVAEGPLFDLPEYRKGPTQGVLDTGRAQLQLSSGEMGGPPALPMPGRNSTNFFHVEAHAAQTMRVEGLGEATLYINQVPCAVGPGCANNLPGMLPEGAKLRVIGPNGYDHVFVGAPDPASYPR